MPIRLSGTLANRPPAAAARNARYYTTDTQVIYQSEGTTWQTAQLLDQAQIVDYIGGALSDRPASRGYLGWVYTNPDNGDRYEGFPDAWALLPTAASFDAAGAATAAEAAAEAYFDAQNVDYNFYYDFAVSGGAQGSIPLVGDNPIPEGFVIVAVFKTIQTVLDSAGHTATAALTSGEAAGDIITAIIVSNASWSTVGSISGLNIKKTMTAPRIPALVIAGQNLTQGKFNIHVDGYMAP